MALVNLPSVKDAQTIEEVIDVVENMRKQTEYLFANVESDNINGVIHADKISIGAGSSFDEGYDPSKITNTYQIVLSNENQSILTNSAGKTYSSFAVTTDVDTYKGSSRIAGTIGTLKLKDNAGNVISTTGITFSSTNPTVTDSGNVTMTINSGISLAADVGYVEIPFTIETTHYIKKLNWNKAKDGAPGYTPVKGTDYFDGQPGQNGTSSYMWIRYSQNADGNPMTADPTGAKYVGIATTTTGTAPLAYASYSWSLVRGTDGIPGEAGADGQTSYLHIKYSDDGFSFTANNGETVGAWIGTYVDFIQADSTVFTAYTWNKVKGVDGADGRTPVKGTDYFDGQPGTNGTSSYLWVRYSQNADGSSMTTSSTGALYIGTAVTSVNSAPSTNTSYSWSLIKGTDGIPGEPGTDGQTSYLHIKYSNDGGTTFTANSGEDVGVYIGTYVDFTVADSTSVGTYTWNKVRGDDAKFVIVTGEQIFKYPTGSTTPSNTTIVLSVAAYGITAPTYQWQYWNGTAWTNSAKAGYNTASYTVAYNDAEWGTNTTRRYRCLVSGAYSDEMTISKLYDGAAAIAVLLSNESHTIPTDSGGSNGNYIGSGTIIYLYEGTTALGYDGVGTSNSSWKVTASGSNITASTTFTDGGTYVTVGDHSAMVADAASVTYTITGKRADGTAISLTKTQTFSKAKAGSDGTNGTPGANAKVADIIASTLTFKSSDGGATYTPSTLTLTPSLQNVTFSKWQYSTNGGSTYADAVSGSSGVTIANNILTLSNTSSLFSSSISSIVFKLLTSDGTVYDTITILKIFDVKGTYIDDTGVYTGKISFNQGQGGTLTLGGTSNGNGQMVVLDQNGNQIANLDADAGGFSNLYVAALDSPTIVSYGDANVTYYVATTTGTGISTPSDDNTGLSWSAPLLTINEALRRIPRHYDGSAMIYLADSQTFYENVSLDGKSGKGVIQLDGQSTAKIHGSCSVNQCTPVIRLYNFTLNSTDTYSALSVSFSDATLNKLIINGIANNGTQYGVDALHGAYVESSGVEVYSCQRAFTGRYGATQMVINGCTGTASINGLYAYGGFIMGSGTAPTGTSANTSAQQGGVIATTFTFASGTYVAPPAVSTTTAWSSTSSDSYTDGAGVWDNTTNDVLQGTYGSAGNYRGCWFFGTAPSTAVTGKTIKQIRVYMTRANTSGSSSSITAVIRPHTYTSVPAGQPVPLGTSYSIGFKWGEAKWVTLPSSFYSHFQSGSAKGIMIYTTTTSNYMRFTTSAKIEITYS